MRRIYLPLLVAVSLLFLGCARSLEVYREAKSPDGSWSVEVLRQKNRIYPVIEGVDVIVRVKNQSGAIIFERVIDNRDLWSDVDDRYHDLTCSNDIIRLGPEFWDGEKFTYFTLNRSLESNARR